jgi:hypothetical protein
MSRLAPESELSPLLRPDGLGLMFHARIHLNGAICVPRDRVESLFFKLHLSGSTKLGNKPLILFLFFISQTTESRVA